MHPIFDYGEYEKFYADKRVKRALKVMDKLAKKMRIKYAIIGGLGAYLHVNNPPQDEPDIDILVYNIDDARRFIRALGKTPGFKANLIDDQDEVIFAHLRFEREIQIDILTSFDESEARETTRIKGVNVEAVEPLIVEKLVRATTADVRMALDLMAFADYNKSFLFDIAREYHMTPTIAKTAAFARRMFRGDATEAEVDDMIQKLADE